jgi:regulator of cell morphogenesis and NO signaling
MNPSMQPLEIWNSGPLTALMDHIVEKHHTFCKRELPLLLSRFKQVIAAYGQGHPELKRMETLFAAMAKELQMHLVKEEQTLFPYIARVEQAVQHKHAVTWPPFGSVENPIRMMVFEHEQTGREFREIRRLSNDYAPPSGVSGIFVALYDGLRAFDLDMDEHIQTEDRLLFPRAVAMELEACGANGLPDAPETRRPA